VLDVGHHGQAVGTLICIGCIADHPEEEVTGGVPGGEGVGRQLGGESTATVTLAGERLALREDAELVRLDVPQIPTAHGIRLGHGRHKLEFVLVLDVPASELALHIIRDALLLCKAGEGNANGPDYVAQLEGLVEGQKGQILVIVFRPSFVATAGNKPVLRNMKEPVSFYLRCYFYEPHIPSLFFRSSFSVIAIELGRNHPEGVVAVGQSSTLVVYAMCGGYD